MEMTSLFEFRTSLLVVFVCWLQTVHSENEETMAGPQRHRGVFYKQTGRNKTIPVSEKPGQELIVFDVDGTLWPYHIDTDPIFQDPFSIKSAGNGEALVGEDTYIKMFPEVEATLLELIEKGYVLAAVSLTNSTYKTMAVLDAFDLTQHFKHMEMAPGPSKVSLITAICERNSISLEDVLYFEKDSDEVVDLIWKHVIVYSVEKGLTKDVARKGLFVFDIRPRKERRQNTQKKVFSDKNKSRPAYEKDGTEIEGFDYNATKIEYS